jgi:hypothetical protein
MWTLFQNLLGLYIGIRHSILSLRLQGTAIDSPIVGFDCGHLIFTFIDVALQGQESGDWICMVLAVGHTAATNVDTGTMLGGPRCSGWYPWMNMSKSSWHCSSTQPKKIAAWQPH